MGPFPSHVSEILLLLSCLRNTQSPDVLQLYLSFYMGSRGRVTSNIFLCLPSAGVTAKAHHTPLQWVSSAGEELRLEPPSVS